MKLGTLLLRDAVVSLGQLEEALRAQVLFGGRLGTNLVELGSLDLETLGACLARLYGVPLAGQDRFEAAPASAIAALPAALADEFLAFPLGPEPRSPGVLGVVFADPRAVNVDALAARLGAFVAPYVAPELRILYHLEQRYDLRRSARYLRAAAPTTGGERRRTRPSTATPIPVRLEPRPRRADPPAPPDPDRVDERLSYLAACNAIDRAVHRDEIADSLLRYCAGRFAIAVLFIARGGSAIGWRAVGDGLTAKAVLELALPLGPASALQVASDGGVPFRGAPPSAGRPIERQLWRELGVDREPEDLMVLPVVVKKRVVNLLYVHGEGGRPIDPEHGDELAELVLRASSAYLRLIQEAKKGETKSDRGEPR